MTFHSTKKAVLCISILVSAALGCQKKFDPNAFDAGAPVASTSAAAVASAAPIDSAAAADPSDAGDGLAPLQAGKPAAHAAAGSVAVGPGSHTDSTAKKDPPECVQARVSCKPLLKTPPMVKACDEQRSACFNKGGHL